MSTDEAVPVEVSEVMTSAAMDSSGIQLNESELIQTSNNSGVLFINDVNAASAEELRESEYLLFEKFVIVEIIMTTVELIISVWAATKMPKWRKNYRNQMLMQLTFARFIKRIIFIFKFLEDYEKIPKSDCVTYILISCQFYIDFVIAILVFFFIKHMYNSLIIVLVKISQNNFYRVLICSWLIPVPVSGVCTAIIVTNVVDKWLVYLLICSIFRWPLIFAGTALYITIVYRVLADKIRHFAGSLAVVTFLLCLIINVYLFSKDVIELWCTRSFSTELIGYISGFLLNLLILSLYAVLIILNFNNKTQSSRSDLPDYSLAEAKC